MIWPDCRAAELISPPCWIALTSSCNEAGASDRASLFETATRALGSPVTGWPTMPLLLLDVPFESEIEAQFLWALVQQSPQVMITVPAGDASTVSQLEKRGVRTPGH